MSVKNLKIYESFGNNREDCPSGSRYIKNSYI